MFPKLLYEFLEFLKISAKQSAASKLEELSVTYRVVTFRTLLKNIASEIHFYWWADIAKTKFIQKLGTTLL